MNVNLIAYAIKANACLSVVKTLAKEGLGADTVSGGEILRALQAGISPEKIIFSGVGKTREEIKLALEKGIFQINVESESELQDIAEIATNLRIKAPLALRLNPDIGAGGHAKITTGNKENKFGIPLSEALPLYNYAAQHPWLEPHGLAVHIGSQITDLAPLKEAYAIVRETALSLREEGLPVTRIDCGGGLGVPYKLDLPPPPDPKAFGEILEEVFSGLDVHLAVEPGRVLVANAGILVTKVLHLAKRDKKTFAIVDAAMNDLIRPTLYEAHHDIWTIKEKSTPTELYDVVGPICETGDTFAENRRLPLLKKGDLIAFMTAGAYGSVMASTYNLRPRLAEVIVNGTEYAVASPRQTYTDLLENDKPAPWL